MDPRDASASKNTIVKPHPWGTFPAEWIPAGQTPAYKRSTSQASCQGGPALPSIEGEKNPKKQTSNAGNKAEPVCDSIES